MDGINQTTVMNIKPTIGHPIPLNHPFYNLFKLKPNNLTLNTKNESFLDIDVIYPNSTCIHNDSGCISLQNMLDDKSLVYDFSVKSNYKILGLVFGACFFFLFLGSAVVLIYHYRYKKQYGKLAKPLTVEDTIPNGTTEKVPPATPRFEEMSIEDDNFLHSLETSAFPPSPKVHHALNEASFPQNFLKY